MISPDTNKLITIVVLSALVLVLLFTIIYFYSQKTSKSDMPVSESDTVSDLEVEKVLEKLTSPSQEPPEPPPTLTAPSSPKPAPHAPGYSDNPIPQVPQSVLDSLTAPAK